MMATILSSHLRYREAVMMKHPIVKPTNNDDTDDNDNDNNSNNNTTTRETAVVASHGVQVTEKSNEKQHHYA